jgi:hypothetical protein
MGAVTTSLGSGLTDPADQTISMNASTALVSNVVLSTTSTYVSGGYDSLGNQYTTRPVAVTDISVRVGRNSSNPAFIALRPLFKTSLTGIPAVNATTSVNMSTLSVGQDITLSTESAYRYKAFANSSTVYYGFEGTSGSGTIEYGRGGSANAIYSQVQVNSTTYTTMEEISGSDKLSGSITQASIPSSPGNPNALSVTDISANIIWSAPTDDGMQDPAAYSASNINGYRINYRNSGSENWKVLVANTGSNALFKVVFGLVSSTYYEIQVAALNDVTDAHNSTYSNITAHVGSRSITYPFTTAVSTNDIRVWIGSEFKKGIVKVWDGSAWLQYPNISIKTWNGTAFEDAALDS